jgi:hypothetical protein
MIVKGKKIKQWVMNGMRKIHRITDKYDAHIYIVGTRQNLFLVRIWNIKPIISVVIRVLKSKLQLFH